MKLIDLISAIDENTHVFVWAHDKDDPGQDTLVSTYDGKDSIDPVYNGEAVESVSGTADGSIDVVLSIEVGKDAMTDVEESTVMSSDDLYDEDNLDDVDDMDIDPVIFLVMYDPDTDDFVASEDIDAIHVDNLNEVIPSIKEWAESVGERYGIEDNIDYSKADIRDEWEDYGTVVVNFAYPIGGSSDVMCSADRSDDTFAEAINRCIFEANSSVPYNKVVVTINGDVAYAGDSLTSALNKLYYYADVTIDRLIWEDNVISIDITDDSDEEYDYTPSASRGDYSPRNPWDAPGMSTHDFI